jgi:hypothetical protein
VSATVDSGVVATSAVEIPRLSMVLSAAFAANPVSDWIFDGEQDRHHPAFFAAFLRCAVATGRVEQSSDGTAVAVWIDRTRPWVLAHQRHQTPLWRVFLQVLAAMVVGTIATGLIFASVIGFTAYEQVTVLYPTQILLAMAAGMSIPVVAWMLVRGMGRRNAAEIAAAIVLPVLPFLGLVWFGVTGSAACWGYRATAVVAVLALLRSRRGSYSTAR